MKCTLEYVMGASNLAYIYFSLPLQPTHYTWFSRFATPGLGMNALELAAFPEVMNLIAVKSDADTQNASVPVLTPGSAP